MSAVDAKAKLLMVTLTLTHAPNGLADVVRREWAPYPDAAYYEGTVKEADGTHRVRTSGTWILLKGRSTFRIDAVSPGGERLGPVQERLRTGIKPETPTSSSNAAPRRNARSDPFASDDLGDAAYGETEGGDASGPESDVTWTLGAEPAVVTPEPGPIAAAADGDGWRRRISIGLGFGKERVTAEGGVSEYSGSTNIGGTSLRAEAPFCKGPWLGLAHLGAHNFTTTVTREDDANGTSTEEEAKVLRLAGRAVMLYDFGPSPGTVGKSYTLAAGVGLGYVRLPMLIVEDEATGVADLEPRSFAGPVAAVFFAKHLSRAAAAGVELDALPMALSGGSKVLSTNALLFWRNAFVRSLFTEVGLLSATDSATVDVTCPDASTCSDESRTTSRRVAARFGFGMMF